MTFDPTQNRSPVKLLSSEEFQTLKDWPHGHQLWSFEEVWVDVPLPKWFTSCIYRGKPAPAVVSKWFNLYPCGPGDAHNSRETVDEYALDNRIGVLRIDTINDVSTCHWEDL